MSKTPAKIDSPEGPEDTPQVEDLVAPVQKLPKAAALDAAYNTWYEDQTPDNLNHVVGALGPSISYALSQGGSNSDPLLKTEARLIAAEAVRTYDPKAGAGLNTWASSQLMRLRRKRRELATPIKVPDRIQIDAWALDKAERSFFDKHDRDPDVAELADIAKMPVKRIQKVRESFRVMPSEGAVEGAHAHEVPDHMEEALAYVHADGDYLDRKILEHKTGYGGADILTPAELGRKFKLTPSQVSRRAKKISLQIQEIEDMLQEIQES